MGLRDRHSVCNHHLRFYIWWPLQSSSNDLLCNLARVRTYSNATPEQHILRHCRFPWSKVPRYIFAQILGSFIAGLVLVGQYHPQLTALAAATRAKGLPLNSLGGPGSILCSFPAPTETNYGYLFFVEFFVDSFIG
jgi:hypothetical protein